MPKRPIANEPDECRFRGNARGGARALGRTITRRAAPRSSSSGDAVASSARGSGAGDQFGGGSGRIYLDPVLGAPGGIGTGYPDIGHPGTGRRTAVWGLFVWSSTLDTWGA